MKAAMLQAIATEISLQKDYMGTSRLETIYFGGGTPSLLTNDELDTLLETISRHFIIDSQAEITLEANPDDLSKQKIEHLKKTSINRLSIGIQSFYEPHLKYMHRAHTALEAETCVKYAQDMGLNNLTIDLIYGIPHPNHSVWEMDLQKAIQLNIPHLSAYCLTIEPKTVFGKWEKQKKIQPIDEEFSSTQFEWMLQALESAGFEQYEISNFARSGQYARHNTGYWLQKSYLGIGPSAHSYNGHKRQFNVANNSQYVQSITQKVIPCTIEVLTTSEQINDYLLTSLRTCWGTDVNYIRQRWNYDLLFSNNRTIEQYQKKNWIVLENNILTLTRSGKLLADEIITALLAT